MKMMDALTKIKVEINKKLRLGIIIGCIAMALCVLFYAFKVIDSKRYIDEKTVNYSCTNTGSINYKVSMIPNSIYNEAALDEGKTYLADLVDNINTLFTYQFGGDKEASISGKYEIVGIVEGLLGNEKESKTVWEKKYVLQPETSFQSSDKNFTLQKEIPINLKQYNDFIQQVVKETNINFDTKLKVYFNIDVIVKNDKGSVVEKLSPSMEIALNTKFFDIKGELKQEKNGTVENSIKVESPTYKKLKTLLCIIASILLIAALLLRLFTCPKTEPDPVEKKIRHILKAHGSRMAAVESFSTKVGEMSDDNIIEMATIEDLIRIADDSGKTILYRTSSDISEIRLFFIIDNDRTYLFEIKEEQLRHEKKETAGSLSF